MYNKIIGRWMAECEDSKKLEGYRIKQKSDVKAMFFIADSLLSTASSGKDTAEAVWMMETSAKQNCELACFAMGQLFHYGWAVKQDNSTALSWYRKALELGYYQAKFAIDELEAFENFKKTGPLETFEDYPGVTKHVTETNDNEKIQSKDKKKSKKGLILLIIFFALTASCVLAWFILKDKSTSNGDEEIIITSDASEEEQPKSEGLVGYERNIIVHEDTRLIESENMEDLSDEMKDIYKNYNSNRLEVSFEGVELDLSDYRADIVVYIDYGLVIIQFSDEDEKERCKQYLNELDYVIYAVDDTYQENNFNTLSKSKDNASLSSFSTGVYKSSHTNFEYNSWGIKDMQLDKFAAYLAQIGKDEEEIIIAVIDTGVEPNPRTKDRILKGIDEVDKRKKYGHVDENGHGTHVCGTILDVTQGLNVKVLPVGVHSGGNSIASSAVTIAMYYSAENGASVMNMSLGAPIISGVSDEQYTKYKSVIDTVTSAGVTVVVAAGNESYDASAFMPSCFEKCIVVGAYGEDRNVTDFSNYGDSVDLVAPGDNILSYVSSYTDDSYEVEKGVYMAAWPGTSMASPHVAALAAMIKLCVPDASPSQIESYIKDYCEIPDGGDSLYYANGICDAEKFVERFEWTNE